MKPEEETVKWLRACAANEPSNDDAAKLWKVADLIDAFEADAEAHTFRLERVRRLEDELRDSKAIASGLRAQLEAARQALDAISDGYGPNHLSAFCRNTADKARTALSKETGDG